MRTTDLAHPESWRAWAGAGFDVRFINPYLEPNEPPIDGVCQPVSYKEIQLMAESLTFNTYLVLVSGAKCLYVWAKLP